MTTSHDTSKGNDKAHNPRPVPLLSVSQIYANVHVILRTEVSDFQP